ncbi:MAG: hypothetical protein ABJQ90_18800, partial [Parasphingorhabdus sp.]
KSGYAKPNSHIVLRTVVQDIPFSDETANSVKSQKHYTVDIMPVYGATKSNEVSRVHRTQVI